VESSYDGGIIGFGTQDLRGLSGWNGNKDILARLLASCYGSKKNRAPGKDKLGLNQALNRQNDKGVDGIVGKDPDSFVKFGKTPRVNAYFYLARLPMRNVLCCQQSCGASSGWR